MLTFFFSAKISTHKKLARELLHFTAKVDHHSLKFFDLVRIRRPTDGLQTENGPRKANDSQLSTCHFCNLLEASLHSFLTYSICCTAFLALSIFSFSD